MIISHTQQLQHRVVQPGLLMVELKRILEVYMPGCHYYSRARYQYLCYLEGYEVLLLMKDGVHMLI